MPSLRSYLIVLLVACGHPAKPTTPPPPLTDPAPEEPVTKADPPAPAPKPSPPKEAEPIDVPLASAPSTYKLVSPGKGAKSVLKVEAKPGAKQSVELAIDFAGKQIAPEAQGGTEEDVAPTLVLTGELEVGETAPAGMKWKLTITNVDARDRKGSKATKEQFKASLGVLQGTVMSGTVSPSGQVSNVSLHVEKPTDKTMGALQLMRISMMPLWPVLPTEAIGVGAKWQTQSGHTIADRIETTETVDFELVSHKGTAWQIKGTTKLKGSDQKVGETNFHKIGGTGTSEATLTEGAFLPATTTTLVTDFTAEVMAPSKDDPTPKPVDVTFHLDQELAVTPKQ